MTGILVGGSYKTDRSASSVNVIQGLMSANWPKRCKLPNYGRRATELLRSYLIASAKVGSNFADKRRYRSV
jgi:hypothetical protein